jgi:hypothetical protein
MFYWGDGECENLLGSIKSPIDAWVVIESDYVCALSR